MKALFLIFHGFEEFNGISKKIRYQVNALKECGQDVRTCYYEVDSDGHRRWRVDEEVIADFGTGVWAKLKKRVCFGAITRYARKEKSLSRTKNASLTPFCSVPFMLLPLYYGLEGGNIFATLIAKGLVFLIIFGGYTYRCHENTI